MKFILLLLCFLMCAPTFGQDRKLQVESNHSTVGFDISIAGFSIVSGKFKEYEILLDWNDNDYTSSNIRSTIQVSSIDTGIEGRDDHLRTADFFDVEQYPTITFQSDSISRVNFSHFIAHGELTMHGKSKNIELPFQITKMDGNTIGFTSRYRLDRTEYGVGNSFQHTSMPDFLAKMIDVKIDFWTKKRKE